MQDTEWLHTYGMWPAESSRLLSEVVASAELTARDYKVLYLYFVCGMTQEQVGERLRVNQSCAGKAIHRAVETLKIAAEVPI